MIRLASIARLLARTGLAVLGPAVAAVRAEPLPTPTFTNVTVHDPSVLRAGPTFYVYGSHLASASSPDLLHWTQISTSASVGNALVPNPAVTFSEVLAWAQTNTFWAPDVVRLGDGRYYLYYCACKGDSPRSALGLAVADSPTGPFTHVAVLLRSGMWGLPGEDGTIYDATVHPNVVDPAVFFDAGGKLWMVYGSYSGGIFILQLDPATGRPLAGQGYGRKLTGGNHARIEGAYILYSPESEYYYLFLSFGGLDAAGGYNIRVARSRQPDGPYVDAAGTDLIDVKGAPGTLFDDASIAPHGVKLMGGYQFLHVAGEPQLTSRGYLSPGHNSAYYDPATGKCFLVFHTRFVGRGEQHEVRVHQMFLNDRDWPVVAPHRYAGETIARITARQVPGDFKLIDHGKGITALPANSSLITLQPDGTITGAVTGTWQLTGDYDVSLALSGVIYRGVFVRQWDDDNQVWVLGFTALSDNGTAWWGSKVAALNAVQAPDLASSPASQSPAAGDAVTFAAAATGAPAPELQWRRNGADIAGATGTSLSIAGVAPADAGLYTVEAANFAGTAASPPAILGLATAAKITGPGDEVLTDQYVEANRNTYDQVLPRGDALAIKADHDRNQITRTSYIDVNGDIVQVEFSGPGTLTLVLADATGPAAPANYNQAVNYMKGHAGIVITGATEYSNVAVFTVGRATAVNQGLFRDDVAYDGIADIAFIAIRSANGRFGGVRTANAHYVGTRGTVGLYAPGVEFLGPVFVGNIAAFDAAQPTLLLGSGGDVRITGGDLLQPNGAPVQVSGITRLQFTAGADSHNGALPARTNRAVLLQDGQDVTTQIVVNPVP